MKVIATVNCADGNESIGTEWKETAIFGEGATLHDVFKWADQTESRSHHMNIVLTVAQEPQEQSK